MEKDEIPVGRAKDIRGQKFGRLTVLYRAKPPQTVHITGAAYWKCLCDCGNTIIVNGSSLRNGDTKSCGCISSINEIGKKYGRLTVIEKADRPPGVCSTVQHWKCRCDCGKEVIIRGPSLRSGKTLSCGCLAKERASKANSKSLLPGERFGKLTVIKRNGSNNRHDAMWLCKCDCGNHVTISRNNLITGNTKSCGCIKSLGEQQIQNILEQEHLNFVKEKTFDNCISQQGGKLRFDFYVNDNYLIEYDGVQHNKPTFGQISFNITNQNDKTKNEYCRNNNIPLIRIPYWHYDDLCIEDLIPETSKFLVGENKC